MILLSLGSNLPSKFGNSKETLLKCILITRALQKYKLQLLKEKNSLIKDIVKKPKIGKEKNQEFLETVNYDFSFSWIKSAF